MTVYVPEAGLQSRVRVKFCGITNAEDARAAVRLGVDAVGLVFYPPSPRSVTLGQAIGIVAELPAFVTRVGLFVNPQPQWVNEVMHTLSLGCLQFHGEETPEECNRYQMPYIKAIRMKDDVDLQRASTAYSDAGGLLLDSYIKGTRGGTGEVFDWSMIPSDLNQNIILAGGLTPENVAGAISSVRPYAVDVSGGIEAARGIKDHDKMNEFMRGVYSACF
jgi:phosphoribosylanthranilate isomerase